MIREFLGIDQIHIHSHSPVYETLLLFYIHPLCLNH